jgi:hypothetical protein
MSSTVGILFLWLIHVIVFFRSIAHKYSTFSNILWWQISKRTNELSQISSWSCYVVDLSFSNQDQVVIASHVLEEYIIFLSS